MKAQVLKFPTRFARRGDVWCEPLKIYFPQVYRITKKKRSFSSAASTPYATAADCDFALFNVKDEGRGIANAIPVRHLSSSDDHSLIVRHHCSELLASAYLQGAEDQDPAHPCGGIFKTDGAIFTMTKCPTRESWSGPTIFYLADIFEDDDEFGVQIWEKSVGIDGELRKTDIFCEED
jgi:hypothetical protein